MSPMEQAYEEMVVEHFPVSAEYSDFAPDMDEKLAQLIEAATVYQCRRAQYLDQRFSDDERSFYLNTAAIILASAAENVVGVFSKGKL